MNELCPQIFLPLCSPDQIFGLSLRRFEGFIRNSYVVRNEALVYGEVKSVSILVANDDDARVFHVGVIYADLHRSWFRFYAVSLVESIAFLGDGIPVSQTGEIKQISS